jgi:BioD-like phosphotransacetylase family protein
MEFNTTTPRIFIAATRQDDGKTTTSLGLMAAIQKQLPRLGYIKPVGQRFVEVEGHKIDEDSVLMRDTYEVSLPIEAMSPIAVGQRFTRDYIESEGKQAPALAAHVREAFNRAAWEKDFVVIEGTGHAGVGSVFDLSNARVASLLQSKVIIVSQGGVGKPIDEIAMNLALFEKFEVEVIGVILNKVIPQKIDELLPFAKKGLARLGLPLLGFVPLNYELRKPTLNQISRELNASFVAGERFKRRRVNRVVIGTASARNAQMYFEPGSLIVTAGDRDDLIMAILASGGPGSSAESNVAGVILTLEFPPDKALLELMRARSIPFMSTSLDSYTVASRINQMTIKTESGDKEKIDMIQQMISANVDVQRIIDEAKDSSNSPQLVLPEIG